MLWTIVMRVIDVLLAALGIAIIVDESWTDLAMFAWCTLGLVSVAIRSVFAVRAAKAPAQEDGWRRRMLGGRTTLAFTIIVALVGIVAGFNIAMASKGFQLVPAALAAVAAILAWSLLQFGFAERYASLFARDARPGEDAPLRFPGTPHPNYLDFVYFAFTLGTSFATSDVEVRSRPIRRDIVLQSVLGFFYNAAILGLAISIVLGK